jgi:uncharacterized protein (TIGR02246 family)
MEDEASVLPFMDELQEAWRNRDLGAYLRLWAEDADLVNRSGQYFRGRQAIEEQWRWLFERGFPEIFSAETVIASVREIAPGVAVVHQRRFEPARSSIAVYVLLRAEGAWKVQAATISPEIETPGLRKPV